MSSISPSAASPAGLTYLTQAGGLLSNLSAVSSATLRSASPQDVVSLSEAAIQAQTSQSLFGIAPSEGNTVGLPVSSPATSTAAGNSILPGVSAADLNNATPQQTSALNSQALRLQQSQALFGSAVQGA